MKKIILLGIMTILLASCGDTKNSEINTITSSEVNIETDTTETITKEELDKELNEIFNSID